MASFDRDRFLEQCAARVPGLVDRAEEGEQLRMLPEESLKDAVAADLLPVVLPTSLGGHGLGLDALCQGTRTLARGCAATAWTLSFFMQHAWLLSRFPSESHDEFFGGGRFPLTAAPLAVTGQCSAVEGGYVVSGRWDFATGIQHADWVMVHALEAGPDLATRFLVLPVDEVTVQDVWFTSGMRATGSNTVVVETDGEVGNSGGVTGGVFVPARRTIAGRELLDSAGHVAGDGLDNIPLIAVLGLTAAASAVGAAEAAVDLFHQRLTERVLAYSLGDKAADQPAAQIRLATAMSDMATARAGWDAAIADVVAAARTGTPTDGMRARTKLAAAAAVRASRQVITFVGEGSGASVYRSDHPFQKIQRDVETLKGHVIFDWDRTAELAGRIALGFELRPTDLA